MLRRLVYIKGSDGYRELVDANFEHRINFVKAYCDRSLKTVNTRTISGIFIVLCPIMIKIMQALKKATNYQ